MVEENFDKLKWDDKFRLSFQLAKAVECINNKDIIHCDLVIDNLKIIINFLVNLYRHINYFYLIQACI